MGVDEAVAGSGLNAVKALKAEHEADAAVQEKPAISAVAPPGAPPQPVTRSVAPPGGPEQPVIKSIAPPGGPIRSIAPPGGPIRSIAPPGGPPKPDIKPMTSPETSPEGALGTAPDPAPLHPCEEAAVKSVAAESAGKSGVPSSKEIKQKAKDLFVQGFSSGELQEILAKKNTSAATQSIGATPESAGDLPANGLNLFNLEESTETTKSANDASAHSKNSCNPEESAEEMPDSAAAQSQDAEKCAAVNSSEDLSDLETTVGSDTCRETMANELARMTGTKDEPLIRSIAPPGAPPKPVIRSIAPPGAPPKPNITPVAPTPGGQVKAVEGTPEAAAIGF